MEERLRRIKDRALIKSQGLINGKWVDSDSKETFPVTDPSDGSEITQVANMSTKETRDAILAAHDALPDWQRRTAKERSKILRKWFDIVTEHSEDLSILLTLENGKPLAESKGEISYGSSFIEWFAEEGKRIYGEVIPEPIRGKRLLTLRQPVGVCGIITPWNFPNAMITRKAAPALAAGCSVVLRPPEDTPLSALALGELALRAGVPPGVFNVVCSSRDRAAAIGEELCSNPFVRKISFTGSTAVGKLLMKQCASTVKRMSLELGGNAPFIVFEDADLDKAVEGAMASKFRNTGQTCVCANRFFVQDKIYDAFAKKLTEKVAGLKVGHGLQEGVLQGPLINERAREKVSHLIKDAEQKGAHICIGGKPHSLGPSYFQPTVMSNLSQDMLVATEEIFGPVATLFRFHDESEAIRMANATPFGLAGYFFSRDMGRIWRVAEALEVGMVGVNEGIISTEVAPFGGVKESGLGREGGGHGIDEYLEVKYVCIGGVDV